MAMLNNQMVDDKNQSQNDIFIRCARLAGMIHEWGSWWFPICSTCDVRGPQNEAAKQLMCGFRMLLEYPLVNVYITTEHHHFQWVNQL